YKASESGEFTFTWKDDDGSDYVAKNKITVA
ncbi:MAG: thiosulfate oxidation carrier complex protein SoxZ, partial [Beijerinckiaceae bacterium]